MRGSQWRDRPGFSPGSCHRRARVRLRAARTGGQSTAPLVRQTALVSSTPANPVAVVGIGADGWDGLNVASRVVLEAAERVIGGPRQLELLPAAIGAERIPLPTPLLPALVDLLASLDDRRVAVLASGDPMFFGIGSTLVRLVGASALHVLPHPSSISLAAARLGWAVNDVEVVSLVGRPLATLHPAVLPRRRVLVLVAGRDAADLIRGLLTARGFGASLVTVLEQLGGPAERISTTPGEHDGLAVVAIDCHADPGTVALPRVPGLPDDAFEHDGQITKRELRALALASLAPVPGELLWDVGAGSGSIGIEWMRSHPACRAIALEPRADRAERIARNAQSLGVPSLRVVSSPAPEAFADLPTPDAIFLGGAVSVPGVIEGCLGVLGASGRLVANGVTLETEVALARWHAELGGTLTRIAVQRAEPLGGLTGWRPAMPVTHWHYRPGSTST
jgi:precorrin-6Y C5,15-methyltransferase (decarboxylating)